MKRLILIMTGAVGLSSATGSVSPAERATTDPSGTTMRPEILWHRNFGPDRGVTHLVVSTGLRDEIAIAGHTSRDVDGRGYSFVGSFDPITGDPTVRHGITEANRWEFEMYWDLDAATGSGDPADYLVAVGRGAAGDVRSGRGFIDIYQDKRDTGRRRGHHWNLAHRVDTDFFQILAVVGLDDVSGRFLVGAGGWQRDERVGGYDAVLLVMDTAGNERWRERMSNGGTILIHDMVINGSLLYLVGKVKGHFEGLDSMGEADGFVRAYRLGRPASGGEVRPVLLWTRRFPTGWTSPDAEPDRTGVLVAASDRRGNLYIAGHTGGFLSERMEDESDVYSLGGANTGFIVKYDADGNRKWIKQFGADDRTVVRAIAADCAGNLWLGGATRGVFGGERRTPGEPHGGFLVRLDPDGNTAWVDSSFLRGRMGSVDADWYIVTGLGLDFEGRLFATGFYADRWGGQPARGKSGFIASLDDPVPHTMGPDGFARCPPSTSRTAPPEDSGQCRQTPDASVLVLPGGRSVPHEGFQDEPACANNVDDDNDGLCDAADPDCRIPRREYEGTTGCVPLGPDMTPRPERFPSPLCSDGIDNDGNGRCDHMEPRCRAPGPLDGRQLPAPPILPRDRPPAAGPACERAVQDRIAWNYEGNTRWLPANVARLCRGAENSTEPARCFQRVMHGGVNHGSGERWEWRNALELCEGTVDADATVDCFQSRIASGESWNRAIEACERR